MRRGRQQQQRRRRASGAEPGNTYAWYSNSNANAHTWSNWLNCRGRSGAKHALRIRRRVECGGS